MEKKNNVNLDSIEDTLYVPLLGRIFVSKKYPDLLNDKKSLELEPSIPPDKIHPNGNEYTNLASATRYFLLDNEVRDFIKEYNNCNVINLGAGLDTLYYRIGNSNAMFYELDLPHIIELRRSLLPELERDKYISGSFLDLSWINSIDANRPTILIASGLFHYFHRDEVATFMDGVFKKIPSAQILFDTLDESGMKIANNFVKKTGNKNAEMYFYVNNAKEYFDSFSISATHVSEYPFYTNTRKILKRQIKLSSKVIMWFSDKLNRVKVVKCDNM